MTAVRGFGRLAAVVDVVRDADARLLDAIEAHELAAVVDVVRDADARLLDAIEAHEGRSAQADDASETERLRELHARLRARITWLDRLASSARLRADQLRTIERCRAESRLRAAEHRIVHDVAAEVARLRQRFAWVPRWHPPRRMPRTGADRRHGFHRRSDDWRDPAVRARVPERLHALCDDIADALDDIERRDGPPDRRTS